MSSAFPTGPSMYGSTPPNYSPYGGQANNGTALLLSILTPLLQTQMSKFGLTPTQFLPQQNLYDQVIARQYMVGQQQAATITSQRDAQTYRQFFSGAYKAAGFDLTDGRSQAHIKRMASDLSGMAPIVAAFMPETFDALHGRRGSALVMSQAIHRAGQHRVDPTTGQTRMRGDTAGRISAELFDSLYGQGASIEAMRGISAGGAGAIYEDLSNRGMLDPSIGRLSKREQDRRIKDMRLSYSDMDRIAERTTGSVNDVRNAVSNPAAAPREVRDEMLITYDAAKARNRIKNMTGAVSAMRDIFGDSGNANAPMAELMKALDQMTQGGFATMSPGKIEQTVRRTNYLAKAAGVNLETVLGLTGQGAGTADRLGVDRSFVPQMLQQTLAFGAGLNTSGVLSQPAWGASGRDKMTLMHQQLGLSAAASPNINRVNALIRMNDQGLIDTSTPEGQKLAKLAAAAKRGDAAALSDSAITSDAAFGRLADKAGVNSHAFQTILGARDANQEFGFKYNTGKLGLKMQYMTDITPAMRQSFGGQLLGVLNENGVANSQKISDAVGNRIAASLRDDKVVAKMANPATRAAELARITKEATIAEMTAAGADSATISKITGDRNMRQVGEAGWGNFDGYQRRYGRSAIDTLRIFSPGVMAASTRAEQDAASDAANASAMSGLGSAGPMRNFIDAIREAGPDADAEKILYQTFGGVSNTVKRAPATSIAKAYVAAQKLHATAARTGPDNKLTEDGAREQLRANAILQGLTDGQLDEEKIRELAGGNPELLRGLRDAVKAGGFDGALKEMGADTDAAPASFLSDAELSKAMPAEVVQKELSKMLGGGTTLDDALGTILTGDRAVVGAKALRSRGALLKIARDRGLVQGEGLESERTAIDAVLNSKDLTDPERDVVARNREDYSLISDVGTEAVNSAAEIRDTLGARFQSAAGATKVTGTVTMKGLNEAMLALTMGGDINTSALSTPSV